MAVATGRGCDRMFCIVRASRSRGARQPAASRGARQPAAVRAAIRDVQSPSSLSPSHVPLLFSLSFSSPLLPLIFLSSSPSHLPLIFSLSSRQSVMYSSAIRAWTKPLDTNQTTYKMYDIYMSCGPQGSHGAPWGPTGAPRGSWGPMGPHGPPWGPVRLQ